MNLFSKTKLSIAAAIVAAGFRATTTQQLSKNHNDLIAAGTLFSIVYLGIGMLKKAYDGLSNIYSYFSPAALYEVEEMKSDTVEEEKKENRKAVPASVKQSGIRDELPAEQAVIAARAAVDKASFDVDKANAALEDAKKRLDTVQSIADALAAARDVSAAAAKRADSYCVDDLSKSSRNEQIDKSNYFTNQLNEAHLKRQGFVAEK